MAFFLMTGLCQTIGRPIQT